MKILRTIQFNISTRSERQRRLMRRRLLLYWPEFPTGAEGRQPSRRQRKRRDLPVDANAQDQKGERDNQPAGSYPMIEIPTMLLSLPVVRQGFGRPFHYPVVEGHRTDQRKHDGDDLDSGGNCSQLPRTLVQIRERQQQ